MVETEASDQFNWLSVRKARIEYTVWYLYKVCFRLLLRLLVKADWRMLSYSYRSTATCLNWFEIV